MNAPGEERVREIKNALENRDVELSPDANWSDVEYLLTRLREVEDEISVQRQRVDAVSRELAQAEQRVAELMDERAQPRP